MTIKNSLGEVIFEGKAYVEETEDVNTVSIKAVESNKIEDK